MVDERDIARIRGAAVQYGVGDEQLLELVAEVCGVTQLHAVSAGQVAGLLEAIAGYR